MNKILIICYLYTFFLFFWTTAAAALQPTQVFALEFNAYCH